MNKFDKDTYPYSVVNLDVGIVRVTFMPRNEYVTARLPTRVGTPLAAELNRYYHANEPIPTGAALDALLSKYIGE